MYDAVAAGNLVALVLLLVIVIAGVFWMHFSWERLWQKHLMSVLNLQLGNFLSTIGRLQAEQQKQIQDFQEDVLGRAKKAKEQAARESMEGQGIIPKPTTVDTISANQGVNQTPPPSTGNAVETGSNPATKGPVLGVSSDD
ncbi:hypothetical protein OIU78_011068 [Salix suchowensis]|nr:hypothetical protein OIU78_011068 [Salix suchowensis]